MPRILHKPPIRSNSGEHTRPACRVLASRQNELPLEARCSRNETQKTSSRTPEAFASTRDACAPQTRSLISVLFHHSRGEADRANMNPFAFQGRGHNEASLCI